MSSGKWRPFCFGLNVLRTHILWIMFLVSLCRGYLHGEWILEWKNELVVWENHEYSNINENVSLSCINFDAERRFLLAMNPKTIWSTWQISWIYLEHVQRYGVSRDVVIYFITFKPKQNVRHFADDIFKCIFLNENIWNSINISLNFVHQGQINNILALV